ncbi:MAG TPA: hypothetical protein VG406_02670 [Isosphaeraceae bacterium]|jgi:thioredoxin-like negative regulator of GroEL|nr:hypothetical protein [Isosphaeraceae bacterium]
MPRRPDRPKPRKAAAVAPPQRATTGPRPRRRRLLAAAALLGVAAAVAAWALAGEDPATLRARAEAASKAEDWPTALRCFEALNRSAVADADSRLGEARALLALGRAAQAERVLIRGCQADPTRPEPWLLRLELLHMEDRPVEAARVGWEAYEAVAPPRRREVLKVLTTALLAEEPDALVRSTLKRWAAADPDDLDAEAALLRRIAPEPHLGDPDVADRLKTLEIRLARDPSHVGVREALVQTLADAGDPDRGRMLLDSWPRSSRDARYDRLRGRWSLDYDADPALAVDHLRRALAEVPHDWKTRYRLARALRLLNRDADARRESDTVALLRDLLSPRLLGPRLDADLSRLDDPRSLLDLSSLCSSAGLARLAQAWRQEAEAMRRAGGVQP